jgi:hypothetical protein
MRTQLTKSVELRKLKQIHRYKLKIFGVKFAYDIVDVDTEFVSADVDVEAQ